LIVNRAFQGESKSRIDRSVGSDFAGSNIATGSIPNLDGNVITSSENEEIPYGPVITGWGPIGNVRMSLDTLHPLSDALQTVLQVDIPLNATGEVGIVNYGSWQASSRVSLN
jgi:alpha-L-arabinofuranosidase